MYGVKKMNTATFENNFPSQKKKNLEGIEVVR